MNPRHPLNQGLICWLDTNFAGGKLTLGVVPDIAQGLYPIQIQSGDWDVGPTCSQYALNFNGTTNRSKITALTTHSTQRTWAMWLKRDGNGEAGLGRVFDKLDSGTTTIETLGYDTAANSSTGGYRFTRAFSTTTGLWDITPFGTASTWHHVILSYDSGATTNNPLAWVNGKPATVTTVTAPVGTASTNTSSYWLGNRGVADHTWLGQIADFRIYNRLITSNGEAFNLYDARLKRYSSIYLWKPQWILFDLVNNKWSWWAWLGFGQSQQGF